MAILFPNLYIHYFRIHTHIYIVYPYIYNLVVYLVLATNSFFFGFTIYNLFFKLTVM